MAHEVDDDRQGKKRELTFENGRPVLDDDEELAELTLTDRDCRIRRGEIIDLADRGDEDEEEDDT